MPPEALFDRIRGEYREMPGLRLTLDQACRLWHVDRLTCQALLDQLVREDFLRRTPTGGYMAGPGTGGEVSAALLRRSFEPRSA